MLTNCLAACAHLTVTVSEKQRDIGRKSSIFYTPLHSTPPLGGFPSEYRHPLWGGKTRMMSLPMVKKIRRYVYSFWRDPRTWQTDRQTDRRTPGDSKDRAYASHRAVKIDTGTFVQALKECVNTLCECGICRVDLTDKRYWIGLANPSSSYSYWLDGSSSTYRRWATGEPNLDSETCVYYSTEGRFFDADCGSVNRYVCKKAGGNNTAVFLVVRGRRTFICIRRPFELELTSCLPYRQ